MGLVIGVIVLAYTETIGLSGVVSAFVGAAAIFGGAAVYGTVTKRDLTSLGGILFMGLIGLVVVMLVQVFFFADWTALSLGIGILGVVIFTGLTAWDVQRIKNGQLAGVNAESASVMGALALYLDFVNLFLFLLRIFGSSRFRRWARGRSPPRPVRPIDGDPTHERRPHRLGSASAAWARWAWRWPRTCARAGFDVRGLEPDAGTRRAPALPRRDRVARPRALASESDVVVICVSDTPDVAEVLFGPRGVAEGARAGSLVIDCSTISPAETRAFADRLAHAGSRSSTRPCRAGRKAPRRAR